MSGFYSVGVDLGGTNLRAAAYRDGEIREAIALPTRLDHGRDSVVRDLCDAVRSLMRDFAPDHECVGITIGSPGPLELPAGILRSPPNLPGWDGFGLRDAIESNLHQPILLENDANLAALAELRAGSGLHSGLDSLCMLTLGTGVGNGIVLNGEVWHGSNGMAGEAGHAIVEPDGAPCGCGSRGCLEQYTSASAVVRMAKEHSSRLRSMDSLTASDVARMAAQGNLEAQAVFEQVGRALAIGLTSLINVLNLPLYVIGGGLSNAWDIFAPGMMSDLARFSYIYRITSTGNGTSQTATRTQIVRGELGDKAGLLGACLLPFTRSVARGTP
jgi:glucokinase